MAPLLIEEHPAGPAKYGPIVQAIRMVLFVAYFLGCCASVGLIQYVGWPLYLISKRHYYAYMAWTKRCFAVIMTSMTCWWSPTVLRLSGDSSVAHQIKRNSEGNLCCEFAERAIIIGNHQVYTDWIYLWFLAYTNRIHGYIFIILKESLKWVPVLGPGMQFFGFIFMARNWGRDKPRIAHRLQKLAMKQSSLADGANDLDPMWLLLFPEGTNFSANGKRASANWAKKQDIQDLRHCLLPRSTGMIFCLQQLSKTVHWVYDCTLYYEGVPKDHFGQTYFTLRSTFFAGRSPKSVNMYWRRFYIPDLPLDDPTAFDQWLTARWREKDELLEYFHEHNRFPPSPAGESGGHKSPYEESEVRLFHWWELGEIHILTAVLAFIAWLSAGVYNLMVYSTWHGAAA